VEVNGITLEYVVNKQVSYKRKLVKNKFLDGSIYIVDKGEDKTLTLTLIVPESYYSNLDQVKALMGDTVDIVLDDGSSFSGVIENLVESMDSPTSKKVSMTIIVY